MNMHVSISQHTLGQCVTTVFTPVSAPEQMVFLTAELSKFLKAEKLVQASLKKQPNGLSLEIASLKSTRRFSIALCQKDIGLLTANDSWMTNGRFDSNGNLILEMRELGNRPTSTPTDRTKVFPLIDRV